MYLKITKPAEDNIYYIFDGVNPIQGTITWISDPMKYEAINKTITLDGSLTDWAGLSFRQSVPFITHEFHGGELVIFETYGPGTWNGIEDHSMKFAFAWDEDNLYLCIVVKDDSHDNPYNSMWNGDSVQLIFSDDSQVKTDASGYPGHFALYNYALGGDGETIKHHQQGPPIASWPNPQLDDEDTKSSITRDESKKETTYELSFSAKSLNVTGVLTANMSFGVGILANDGDMELNDDGYQDYGQVGQSGWSGWGPHSVVYGKDASKTGLVTLVGPEN